MTREDEATSGGARDVLGSLVTRLARCGKRVVGHSLETPRRWWFALPFLGEIRFYRYGVEIYIGPDRRFLAAQAGTLGYRIGWVVA